jgi:hypothetical protein
VDQQQRTVIATGVEPRWRRDGQELFYRAANGGDLMALDISAVDGEIRPMPRLVIAAGPTPLLGYDVAADGQRFLVTRTVERRTPDLTAVVNWQEALRQPR